VNDIIIFNMKTIAISIEEDILRSMDELAKKHPRHGGNRSRIVRAAIKEFLKKEQRQAREAREREIFKRHQARLERQARALISEQAKP
jgi:metal-responsive CopG/Arc/MetJ family transcriptional regulator